jgi:magnesium transporter
MARLIKKHRNEIGLSPFELIFRGEQKVDQVQLRVINYSNEILTELELKSVEEVIPFITNDFNSWFNVDGLHDIKLMQKITEVFNINGLIVADVLNTENRPKVTEYENALFVSVKMLHIVDNESIIENLSLVLTENTIITFQEQKGDVFEPVRDRLRKQKRRIVNGQCDYLLFALLDIVVDNYIYFISELGEKIEHIEEKLIKEPSQTVVDEINKYKRELNQLRKIIIPTKEMLLNLSKIDSELIENETDIHLKELVDNINQAYDSTESYREILSDQLNSYHTYVSTKLNDIMKFLTIFSVVFIPLTFIAGIYGTNFDNVPELHYEHSYFIMWGVMIVLTVGMLYYFKKKKWF